MNKYVSYKIKKFGEDYPEWAGYHFFSSANERDRAINKAHKHATVKNVNKAKYLRNQVNLMKRNLKRDYVRQVFYDAGKDNKKLW